MKMWSGRVSQPLDTNFALIETVAAGAWPDITEKIFVHDHYRNKGAVEPVFLAFPKLIELYGQINSFEFYLIEHKSVEEEGRLEAPRRADLRRGHQGAVGLLRRPGGRPRFRRQEPPRRLRQ